MTTSRPTLAPNAISKAARIATALAVALVGLLALAVPAGAQTRSTPGARAHQSCPAGAITFTGALSNGKVHLGKAASGSGIAGDVCGTIALSSTGALDVTIPAANFTFSPSKISLFNLIDLPSTITVDSAATGTMTGNNGAYTGSLTVTVTATVQVLGFSCSVGPFTPQLTTGKSGSVTGKPLTGSLSDLSGELVAGTFSVPAVQPSKTCPGIIAAITNLATGLPLASGASTLTSDTSLDVSL